MKWPPGKIAPCADCDWIKPLRVINGALICADCAHEFVDDQEETVDGSSPTRATASLNSSSTGAVATDGGERQ